MGGSHNSEEGLNNNKIIDSSLKIIEKNGGLSLLNISSLSSLNIREIDTIHYCDKRINF